MIEILVALAIVMFIGVIGVVAGLDSYQRYLFRSDLDTISALLSKARSSAAHSIGAESHGVYFGDADHFILFRGTSYAARNPDFDLLVDRSNVTDVTGTSTIVFWPPSGESDFTDLVLDNGINSFNVKINNEGGIDW
jgi:hypothetical protein